MKKRLYLLLGLCFPTTFLLSVEFVLFTQPKTGTHLLIPILETLTGKKVYWAEDVINQTEDREFSANIADLKNPESFVFSTGKVPWDLNKMEEIWKKTKKNNTFLHLHPPYSKSLENFLKRKNCINFFIKRDPRDQVVSLLNHFKYIQLDHKDFKKTVSDDEMLLNCIQNRFREKIIYFNDWLQSPLCCILEFHKLMGSHGGAATDQDALGELKKITKALAIDISDDHLLKIYKEHFGKGWSFYQGKVGSWKRYFKEHHKLAIKKEIGDLLIELGHETDDEW
jgi:hypothetical protein